MAVLASIVSGAYMATYASSDIGQQEDGFRLRVVYAKEEILTNGYGKMVIDSVYCGGNCFLSGVLIERDKVVKKSTACIFNPYSLGQDGTSRQPGLVGVIGRMDFPLSDVLTLTSLAAALSSTTNIGTITALNAIVDKDFSVELVLANKASALNMTFRLYPFTYSGNDMWFYTT
jgi:hypothetical protein